MVERQRVAEIFAGPASTSARWKFGSGYQITRGLVLTAAHVVLTGGVPAPEVAIRLLGDSRQLTARVRWWRDDELIDAAVLEIADLGQMPPDLFPVRWGRLTGQRGGLRCEAIGFPDALRDTIRRDTEHLQGTISPGTRVKAHRHDVLVESEPDDPSQWGGISGSAVFCGELLTGVLITRPPGFAGRRLTAVPAEEILRDPGFAALTGPAEAESVELSGLFDPPVRWNPAASPAYLLRSDAEVVPFRGRSDLLSELERWCQAPAAVSARLITGQGGQGKTRLARELARRLRPDWWVTGWLTQPADSQSHSDQWDLLADTTVPGLVVIDYAETRAEQISQLITRVGLAQRGRLRLLLLARSCGEWWQALTGSTPAVERVLGEAPVVELPPLERTEAGRVAAFRAATTHFALALQQSGGDTDADWISLAAVTGPPPGLAHSRYGSVLALHMDALAALLQAGPAPVPAVAGDVAEDVLLRHEERYWTKTARARGVESLRKTLTLAIAAATLVAAATETHAVAALAKLPGLRDQPEDRQLAVAEWLHDLYPPPGRGYWGSLQPDRLGDHLVGRIIGERPDVFDDLPDGLSFEQAKQFMEVLSRVNVRSRHAAGLIKRLVNTRPDPLAKAAIVAATRSENPAPLIDAIQPLPDVLADQPELLSLLAALTHNSPLFGRWPDTANQAVAGAYRRARAHDDPVTYRPKLAWALFEQAKHLAHAKQLRRAQDAAEETVAIWRDLDESDDQRTGLAAALNVLAVLQNENNRPRDALPIALESTEIWEQLTGEYSSSGNDVMGLIEAFSNLAAIRNKLGQKKQSLNAAQRALEAHKSVSDPDPWQINAAVVASVNAANRLLDMRRTEEALAYHREAVRIRRQLTESFPHLFDSDLASSLHNLAKVLAQEGHAAEAFERIDEATEIYTYLAALGPDVYGPKLMEVTIFRSMIPDAPALMSQYRAHKRQQATQKKREKQKRKKPDRKRQK